ncbi:MAG: archease [Candidatus Woesearchaeota archaeon]
MYKFEFLDHLADAKVRVIADTIEEVFQGISDAYLDLVCKKARGFEIRTFDIPFQSDDQLIFDFVSELIYLTDSEQFVPSKVKVLKDNERLSFIIEGKRLLEYKTYVKAITYHELKFEKKDNIFIVEFILDL